MRHLTILLFFLSFPVFSQKGTVVRIDSLPKQGILLNQGWKFHPGDNAKWANPNLDDSRWEAINPALDIYDLPQIRNAQMGWFRLNLQIDSTIADQPLALIVSQVGASEIYLDGKLLYRLGTISKNFTSERTRYLRNHLLNVRLDRLSFHIIAVRYSFTTENFYVKLFNDNPCLRFLLQTADDYIETTAADQSLLTTQQALLIGFFLLLGAFALFLNFLFKTEKFYLFLGLYCLGQFAQISCQFGITAESTTTRASLLFVSSLCLSVLSVLAFLISLYILFQQRKRWFFSIIVSYAILTVPFLLLFYRWGGIFSLCFYLVLNMDTLRLSFQAARRHHPGARILFMTILMFYVLFAAFVVFSAIDNARASYLTSFISLFVAPFGMALFLAGEFARTNRSLVVKLAEVETLSAEKQQILAAQNETLEGQVINRTAELNQSLTTLKATQTQLIQKEKLASLGELTAGIAHEIQNPLNFVNNFSELSVELVSELLEERNKEQRERDEKLENELLLDLAKNQEKINYHGKRASGIVKGMLEHSRTGTGERVATDLNRLTDEYLRLAYHGMKAKDHNFQAELEVVTDSALPLVKIVPQEIGRVLLNLYNNAFYAVQAQLSATATGYCPKVKVQTKNRGSEMEIRVLDNGIGIPDLIRPKIFQPFYTTKPTGEGIGLGLSLSYDIITKGHGGTLSVESTVGQSSEFIITLPVD